MKKIALYFLFFVVSVNVLKAKECFQIYYTSESPIPEATAAKELCQYLKGKYSKYDFVTTNRISDSLCIVVGSYEQLMKSFNLNNIEKPKGYAVMSIDNPYSVKKFIIGADSRSTLDGVYGLLEKLGYGFYLTHDSEPMQTEKIDFSEWDISDQPLMKERIVFTWHNFVSGCTGWNYPEWHHWIKQSSKMHYNSIMVHAYGNNPMFQFEFNGIDKTVGYMNTSNSGRDWGGEHINDVRLLPGGKIFKDSIFGSIPAMVPDNQRVEAATQLMQQVFRDAKENGMQVIFALDCDTKEANSQEIILSLPEKARFKTNNVWLVNPDVPEGYEYYKKIISTLVTTYPDIDKFAVWIRNNPTPWTSLPIQDMPKSWEKEYAEFIKQEGRVLNMKKVCGAFGLAKMVKAYQKALKELGRDNIEVMVGSWDWDFIHVANYTMPNNVSFIPLDYGHTLDHPATQYVLSQVGDRRKLIPVIWAHHDDHRYIGRSYYPYPQLANLLEMEKASGIGIIHWTTAPHDLFFKNVSKQVWHRSKNENLRTTIEEYVGNEWKNHIPALEEYLHKWSAEAPMFGRETSSYFFSVNDFNTSIVHEFGSCDEIMRKSKERLALLETIKQKETKHNTSLIEYFKEMELFYLDFFSNQEKYNHALELIKQNKREQAGKELAETYPEKVIESYANSIQKGYNTMGEKGIVFSMGTRYYPHFINLKQMVGMQDIKIRFAKTKHDELAQWPGDKTWYIDEQGLWRVLGNKEINGDVIESNDYVTFDKAIKINLSTFYGHDLPAGEYQIMLETLPASSLDIYSATNDSDETKINYTTKKVNDKIQNYFNIHLSDKKSYIKLLSHGKIEMYKMIITPK